MKEAIKRLPAIQEEKGRATIGAAYTLWESISYIEAVSGSCGSTAQRKRICFGENYSQIFGPDNEYNEESILKLTLPQT